MRTATSRWDWLDSYQKACSAGPCWRYLDFTIVSDLPEVPHTEVVGNIGANAHPERARRLHCADGPAVRWRDGTALYALHGVVVPADLVESQWTPKQIMREPNLEVRRVAIEHLGWERWIAECALQPIHGPVPDPGNPGNSLTLYNVPGNVVGQWLHLLLCVNASPERDGSVRRYALIVPGNINDAVAAAAWTFATDTNTYRALQRAT